MTLEDRILKRRFAAQGILPKCYARCQATNVGGTSGIPEREKNDQKMYMAKIGELKDTSHKR